MRDVPPPGDQDPDEQPGPGGHVHVTGPGPLVVAGLIGLVLGWGSRWVAINTDRAAPDLGWLVVGVSWFVVALTVGVALLTRRTVQTRPRELSAQQGLVRLVWGKSIARIAAFALGGFLGMAISRLGIASESADEVILRAMVGALGAAIGIAAGLLLEHACRVPPAE